MASVYVEKVATETCRPAAAAAAPAGIYVHSIDGRRYGVGG
jgi:hypothetical protein